MRGTTAPHVVPAGAAERVERLWLALLQRLASGVAHELRNALNGVAVNLEVVRSRAAREGAAASAVGSFATAASEQLEQVIEMTEALVSAARPPRQPASVGRILEHVAMLVRPPVVAAGGTLRLIVEEVETTSVPAEAVRAIAGSALYATCAMVSGTSGEVRCTVRPEQGVTVEISASGQPVVALDDDVQRVAADYGIGVSVADGCITLTFPV